MEITYIGHSGFLIEWETCYWLFDYYQGKIPDLVSDKMIFVFVSHKHGDHFNPGIFRLKQNNQKVIYVLSSDIMRTKENNLGIPDEITDDIISVKPRNEYELFDADHQLIELKTLKSTDCGVAFLLKYQGKTIYHAGDLNLWVWKEESKQYNNNMTAMFQKEMTQLIDIPIDIAFAPLDPRQEEWYYMGLESLINTAKVRYVFPMHFWDKPSVISQFKLEKIRALDDTQIIDIESEGQNWRFDKELTRIDKL